MDDKQFIEVCRCGETTTVQFKELYSTDRKIAEEFVAFANTNGGDILFGVKDETGELVGLTYDQLQTYSSLLGHVANEQVRPTIYISTEVVSAQDKHFIVCHVEQGKNKPYKDLSGNIWVKQGADKRRVTDNTEILSLFQSSGTFFAEKAMVEETSISDLDERTLDTYFQRLVNKDFRSFGHQQEQVLKNTHIASKDGSLTLAGLMFFGRYPQRFCPAFMVKAVSFYGNNIGGTTYRDSKDIIGTIPEMYSQALAFLKSNLHSIQAGQSFNSIGQLEIAEDALSEILQNSCVHRDYLLPAPVRVLIFDNRVEIISPGALAGGLTIDAIEQGETFQRNPQMASFCSLLMEYRGIGSGLVRARMLCPNLQIENDEVAHCFKVIIPRTGLVENIPNSTNGLVENDKKLVENTEIIIKRLVEKADRLGEKLGETRLKILRMLVENSTITIAEMGQQIGISTTAIEKHLNAMRGIYLERKGADKGGCWIVL